MKQQAPFNFNNQLSIQESIQRQIAEKMMQDRMNQEKNAPFVLKPKKGTSAWIYFNTETVAKLKEEQGLE